MRKRKKFLFIFSAVATAVLFLHFVPIDSRTGYIGTKSGSANDLPTLNYNYRWVSGGVNAWNDQLSNLSKGIQLDTLDEQRVHLRLYLF